jgi:hypothetical protein
MVGTDDILIHNLDADVSPVNPETTEGFSFVQLALILLVVIIFGIGIGFGVAKLKGATKTASNQNGKVEQTAGIADKKTFKDSAEGILKEGGIDGEGNFHLERPGGESQNVYITSTTVDLSKYVGKKVRVWGATFQGEKAGWLMDVGLVEVL